MDSEAFRKYGKEMVDFVANFWDTLDDRNEETRFRPLPSVQPGFIWNLVPPDPPSEKEAWADIFKDLWPVVLNNNTHWQHPNFFAYYPTACNYAGIIADILSGGISSIGFSWKSSPSMTELEMAMCDWLCKSTGLPSHFLNSDPGPGGGLIQSTASDATMVALLSARARAVNSLKSGAKEVKGGNITLSAMTKVLGSLNIKESFQRKISSILGEKNGPENLAVECTAAKGSTGIDIGCEPTTFHDHDPSVFSRLVAYCSNQAHSSVEKAMMLCGVRMRKIDTRIISSTTSPLSNFSINHELLEAFIKEDRSNGLTPFIFVLTIGTTNTCAVESLRQVGPICAREKMWVHVDAAYAGSFLLCEEFRYMIDGIEFADSFNFNSHKAMMINFDCSPMWFKNASEAVRYFNVDPLYLKHEHQAVASDYRHLQIALGRRFRSLKIWFVLRAIGIKRIQEWLRTQVVLAKHFAELIVKDPNFELFVPQHLGLVCFRLKAPNEVNEALISAINEDRRIHLVASSTHGVLFLRFAVCSSKTSLEDVAAACDVIHEISKKIFLKNNK